MKKAYSIGLSVLLILGLVYVFWPLPKKAIPNQKELLQLKAQNDSLHQVNQELNTTKILIESQSDSIHDLIQKDQQIIDQLKKRQHEEIRAIDHYDHDELYRFFTNYQLKTTGSTD